MKSKLTFLFLALSQILWAQNFIDPPLAQPFEDVGVGSIAFSDVNGDGYEDVFITGDTGLFMPITKLYTNDETGNFTEVVGTPFEGLIFSSIAFSDINLDGYEDVLFTGLNSSMLEVTKLYTNDGAGNFTEMMDTPFTGVAASAIAFSDVDNDGYEDVIIAGADSTFMASTKLYINDGPVFSANEIKIGISLDFGLYPNPSTSSTLFINYDSAEASEVTVNVYHINGVLLKQQKEFAVTGQQVFAMDISYLTKGNYLIELNNGKERGFAKLVVQ